ncbi:MAG: hypothetical protein GF347_02415 [Candidatus Moranbacteria bacterium]|nr:hypothetical protein [Candidatus Moranbacteria bacterium]
MLKQERKSFYRIFFIVLLIIIFIIFNRQGFFKPLKGIFISLFTASSDSARKNSIDTRNFFSTLLSIDSVIEENNHLKELELKHKSLKQENNEILEENQKLREELELLPRNEFNLETAEIVGSDIASDKEVLIINKGQEQGIRTGMPVIISDRIFVGEVYEVFSNRSKIILSVSSLAHFDVTSNEKDYILAAQGSFDLELKSEKIQNNINVEEGDVLITAGKLKKFPKGLLVGKVIKLRPSLNGLSNEAIIQPFYSASNLKFVSVITGLKEKESEKNEDS